MMNKAMEYTINPSPTLVFPCDCSGNWSFLGSKPGFSLKASMAYTSDPPTVTQINTVTSRVSLKESRWNWAMGPLGSNVD